MRHSHFRFWREAAVHGHVRSWGRSGHIPQAGRGRLLTPSGHYATGPVPKIAYHRLELSGTGLAMKRREFVGLVGGAAVWPVAHKGNRRLHGLLAFLHLNRSRELGHLWPRPNVDWPRWAMSKVKI